MRASFSECLTGRRDPFPGPQSPALVEDVLGGEDRWEDRPDPLARHPGVYSQLRPRTHFGFLGLGEGLSTANLDLAPKMSIFKGPIVTQKQ